MIHEQFLVNRFILTLSVFFFAFGSGTSAFHVAIYRVNDFFGKNDIYS